MVTLLISRLDKEWSLKVSALAALFVFAVLNNWIESKSCHLNTGWDEGLIGVCVGAKVSH